MEARMKKFRQVSPERSKVWTEKSPKYHQNRKVPVVYYLCRNRQLEHPHFMEVPLSSPDALYLRDVIERLNVLRGRGMASIYSWSSKSYKNGFVWHDLCEDDLIHPAHGNEYVLKGSELFDESNSVPDRFSPIANVKPQSSKQLPEATLCSSSSSSLTGKDQKHPLRDEEFSPPPDRPCSSAASPESSGPSLSLMTEYKVFKSDGSADASTQTEESSQSTRPKPRETCTRGVSTEIRAAGSASASVSPPPSTCSATSSSGGKTETLESLIRADAGKMNSFRILEEEEISNPRMKATNVLMQLISCGSISVKEHGFGGFVPTYGARFSNSKFGSPLFSASMMMGELDCLSENPKFSGMRLEDKEYFSGSLIETKLGREDGHSVLKRSSSYNADRCCKQLDPIEDREESTSAGSKCIPRSIKASLTKQPRSESMRSPLSDRPRNSSSGGLETSKNVSPCMSNGASKRVSEPFSGRNESKRLDSFREDEKVIKIEERLASGARVIIQSKAPLTIVSSS